MKVNRTTCWAVLVLTVGTSVTPMRELVAEDANGGLQPTVIARPAVNDVELAVGGALAGQVIDTTGQPLAGRSVVVRQSGQEPISTRTDPEGRFRLHGLHAGVCRIECGETALACRCWSPRTAPPAAARELLLTEGQTIERGQRPICDLLTGPVLIGLIIAAAIAIPIAVHNSKNNAS